MVDWRAGKFAKDSLYVYPRVCLRQQMMMDDTDSFLDVSSVLYYCVVSRDPTHPQNCVCRPSREVVVGSFQTTVCPSAR
eukprot:scaffold4553_cov142-Amphora_coffeaeformis.AAC.3